MLSDVLLTLSISKEEYLEKYSSEHCITKVPLGHFYSETAIVRIRGTFNSVLQTVEVCESTPNLSKLLGSTPGSLYLFKRKPPVVNVNSIKIESMDVSVKIKSEPMDTREWSGDFIPSVDTRLNASSVHTTNVDEMERLNNSTQSLENSQICHSSNEVIQHSTIPDGSREAISETILQSSSVDKGIIASESKQDTSLQATEPLSVTQVPRHKPLQDDCSSDEFSSSDSSLCGDATPQPPSLAFPSLQSLKPLETSTPSMTLKPDFSVPQNMETNTSDLFPEASTSKVSIFQKDNSRPATFGPISLNTTIKTLSEQLVHKTGDKNCEDLSLPVLEKQHVDVVEMQEDDQEMPALTPASL